MRSLLAYCLLFSCTHLASAQEQEQKLLDRLLKPNAALQSSAQNKKFLADGASIDKRATVGAFYVQEQPKAKAYSQTRAISPAAFNSQLFYAGQDKTHFQTSSATAEKRSFATSTSSDAHPSRDRDKAANTRDFSGSRPFLEKGKSQKSLSRQNPPMTIEQVRELLNKNK